MKSGAMSLALFEAQSYANSAGPIIMPCQQYELLTGHPYTKFFLFAKSIKTHF